MVESCLNNPFAFLGRLIILVVCYLPYQTQADTLQEGWYRVTVGAQHAGYLVQRYEFDSKTKHFRSTYFLRTNALGGDFSESLQAESTDSLVPINYKFTHSSQVETKLIDADFQKDVMSLKITSGGKTESLQKAVKKGTFLSTFLIYLVLQNKSGGLKIKNNYAYNAIAEEDGAAHNGEAYIAAQEKYDGQPAFKILNSFKGVKFIGWVSPMGVILGTKSPLDGMEVKMVGSRNEAVGAIPLSEKSLEALFGTVPLATLPGATSTPPEQAKKLEALQPPKSKIPKGLVVPPGKGLDPTPSPAK